MTRRPLGPGPALREALTARTPPQRRPAWLREDPDTAANAVRRRADLLAAAPLGLAARVEQIEEVDCDELRETAVVARAMGEDPVAVVDRMARTALARLEAWEADLARLAAGGVGGGHDPAGQVSSIWPRAVFSDSVTVSLW
ncbi:hypothetical protein ACFU7Y_20210 [Kitasatospora sp. NPDC057542]|uniref:hypothetical protein n=1 Tax=Kitasatospora sp. NPDC057542 TaxID=3346162 RepID=UPI00369D3749